MKVILHYEQVISTDIPTLPLNLPQEEIVDAPEYVEVGWYRFGDKWIPPQSSLGKESKTL